jgi:hypothetical protein
MYYKKVNLEYTINNFKHKNNFHLLGLLEDHIKYITHLFHHIVNNN